ncbi:MAG: hypothetical protein WAW52_13705 [Methanothrix sp.]
MKELLAVFGFSYLHFLQINILLLGMGTKNLPQLGQYSGVYTIAL